MNEASSQPSWLQRGMKIAVPLALVVLIPIAFGMQWSRFLPLFTLDSLRFLAIGIVGTMIISVVAILVSLPVATLLALGRLSHNRYIRWPCVAFIEVVRSLPLLLLIFYINLRFPGLGVFDGTFEGFGLGATIFSRAGLSVAIALMFYTAAVNAELLRSGILSLDRGQNEAARSLGLSYARTMQLVILPQAYKRILAPLIAQFTILLKDSSLGYIVGFLELQKRATILFQLHSNPMETFYVVALIYFGLNYLLGLSSKLVQRRQPTVSVRLPEM